MLCYVFFDLSNGLGPLYIECGGGYEEARQRCAAQMGDGWTLTAICRSRDEAERQGVLGQTHMALRPVRIWGLLWLAKSSTAGR